MQGEECANGGATRRLQWDRPRACGLAGRSVVGRQADAQTSRGDCRHEFEPEQEGRAATEKSLGSSTAMTQLATIALKNF